MEADEKDADERPRLPFDLVEEILSWLPVKSILKFRCVCKEWYNLFLNPKFILLHIERSKAISISSSDLQIKKAMACKCRSFLFFGRENFENFIYACNPAMHQIMEIRLPSSNLSSNRDFIVSCSSAMRKHKVVSFTKAGRCGILTLGISNLTWRDLGFFPNLSDGCRLNYALQSHGALHWWWIDYKSCIFRVASLDVESEKFSANSLHSEKLHFSLLFPDYYGINWDGCFAVCVVSGEGLRSWVLKDYKKGIWEEYSFKLGSMKEGAKAMGLRPAAKQSRFLIFRKSAGESDVGYSCFYDTVSGRLFEKTYDKSHVNYVPSLLHCTRVRNYEALPDWYGRILSRLSL